MAGLAVAGSGLWMTLFYPGAPGGDLLWGIRLLVGSAMAAAIVLGFTAIRRRDIPAHRAWMMRAYALGLGAGTQAFTEGIGEALLGTTDLSKAISLGSGWVINAIVAELVIRRPAARRAGRARARAAVVGGVAMNQRPGPHAPAHYELRIEGHLDEHWSAWFGGLTLIREDDGTTTLRGA